MKTLDEVINIFEKACDLERRCEDCSGCLGQEEGCPNDGANAVPDALHYLKEYRSDKLQYDADRREWYETWQEKLKKLEESRQRFIDKLKELDIGTLNEPLTWDELRTMEGKPVWYEHEFWKGWIILGKVEQGANCEMIPDREEKWYIVKDGSAKAYRKER